MATRNPDSKQRTSAESYWLGAEALPGGLAEINRVNQAWLDAAVRHQRFVKQLRQRGFAATAIHWTKEHLFLLK
jgi:hypothetical protein